MSDHYFRRALREAEGPSGTGQELATRRAIPRFPFRGIALVTELSSGARVLGRIKELGPRGCYIETLNPFPRGTGIRLRIRKDPGILEVPGRVLYAHPGNGMGIHFGLMTAENKSVLEGWLAECGAAPPDGP